MNKDHLFDNLIGGAIAATILLLLFGMSWFSSAHERSSEATCSQVK